MKTKIEIKADQKKTKRLFIPITPDEHATIKMVCKEKNIKISELIRFSLKQIIEF